MSNKEFTKIKLSELVEYENNSKLHPTEQIMKIMDSIIAFGYNDLITVDENNLILEGHGRALALNKLISDKDKEIEIMRLTGLDEAQKVAYRIAHNKINVDTSFDFDKIGKDFNFLEDTDYFDATGFDSKEISEIWDKEDEESSSVIEDEETKVIAHTCPECGHNWQENISKSKKNNGI